MTRQLASFGEQNRVFGSKTQRSTKTAKDTIWQSSKNANKTLRMTKKTKECHMCVYGILWHPSDLSCDATVRLSRTPAGSMPGLPGLSSPVRAKENQKAGGGSGSSGRQKSDKPVDTKKEAAKLAGVSTGTYMGSTL